MHTHINIAPSLALWSPLPAKLPATVCPAGRLCHPATRAIDDQTEYSATFTGEVTFWCVVFCLSTFVCAL